MASLQPALVPPGPSRARAVHVHRPFGRGKMTHVNGEDRDALIGRMLKARTKREVATAKEAADRWLDENPGDLRVIAAGERLSERSAKLRDGERRANGISTVVLVSVWSITSFVAFVVTEDSSSALILGLLTGLVVVSEAWVLLSARRDPNDG